MAVRPNRAAELLARLASAQAGAALAAAWYTDRISNRTMWRPKRLPLKEDFCLVILTGQAGRWLTGTPFLERRGSSLTVAQDLRAFTARTDIRRSQPRSIRAQGRVTKCSVRRALNTRRRKQTTETAESALARWPRRAVAVVAAVAHAEAVRPFRYRLGHGRGLTTTTKGLPVLVGAAVTSEVDPESFPRLCPLHLRHRFPHSVIFFSNTRL